MNVDCLLWLWFLSTSSKSNRKIFAIIFNTTTAGISKQQVKKSSGCRKKKCFYFQKTKKVWEEMPEYDDSFLICCALAERKVISYAVEKKFIKNKCRSPRYPRVLARNVLNKKCK